MVQMEASLRTVISISIRPTRPRAPRPPPLPPAPCWDAAAQLTAAAGAAGGATAKRGRAPPVLRPNGAGLLDATRPEGFPRLSVPFAAAALLPRSSLFDPGWSEAARPSRSRGRESGVSPPSGSPQGWAAETVRGARRASSPSARGGRGRPGWDGRCTCHR